MPPPPVIRQRVEAGVAHISDANNAFMFQVPAGEGPLGPRVALHVSHGLLKLEYASIEFAKQMIDSGYSDLDCIAEDAVSLASRIFTRLLPHEQTNPADDAGGAGDGGAGDEEEVAKDSIIALPD
jgi:hypothetical protein